MLHGSSNHSLWCRSNNCCRLGTPVRPEILLLYSCIAKRGNTLHKIGASSGQKPARAGLSLIMPGSTYSQRRPASNAAVGFPSPGASPSGALLLSKRRVPVVEETSKALLSWELHGRQLCVVQSKGTAVDSHNTITLPSGEPAPETSNHHFVS